jgi:maleylpyruvate isomerase
MEAMTTERERAVGLLGDAANRLLRTVDGFHGEDWAAPSLLPGWSRAHVVAHLALNADGLARGLRGVVADDPSDEPRTMYDSDEKRDADIAELATADPAEIRDRLLGGTTILHEAVAALPEDAWERRIERTPGGREIRADAFPGMRLRELEIHHVDLDGGYTTADWAPAFSEHLLDAMEKRVSSRAFEVRPLDSSRTWLFGSDDAEYPVPVVTGPAADTGWWLTGRPAPDTLHCSQGELPTIEGW